MTKDPSRAIPPNNRFTMLGIRAAGLLMVGIGAWVLEPLLALVWDYGLKEEEPGWSLGTFMVAVQQKSVVITFVSSMGPCLAFLAVGVYLLRCDPGVLMRQGRRSA